MTKNEALKKFKEIRTLVLKEENKLKKMREESDLDNPLDVEIIEKTKAMVFEKVLEIIK